LQLLQDSAIFLSSRLVEPLMRKFGCQSLAARRLVLIVETRLQCRKLFVLIAVQILEESVLLDPAVVFADLLHLSDLVQFRLDHLFGVLLNH